MPSPCILDDAFELEYDVQLSMREWSISKIQKGRERMSKWAIPSPSGGLIIDSIMRDHYVVSMQFNSRDKDNIKVSLTPPSSNEEDSALYSLSSFSKTDTLLQIEKDQAISQIRWLKVPGTMCEGIFFSSKQAAKSFIPIMMNARMPGPFSVGQIYSSKFLFEFIQDNQLL